MFFIFIINIWLLYCINVDRVLLLLLLIIYSILLVNCKSYKTNMIIYYYPNYLGLAAFVLYLLFSWFFRSLIPVHKPIALISCSIVFNHIFFGLPLSLFPSSFIFITTLTTFVSSHLITCPSHLSLFTLILSTIDATNSSVNKVNFMQLHHKKKWWVLKVGICSWVKVWNLF